MFTKYKKLTSVIAVLLALLFLFPSVSTLANIVNVSGGSGSGTSITPGTGGTDSAWNWDGLYQGIRVTFVNLDTKESTMPVDFWPGVSKGTRNWTYAQTVPKDIINAAYVFYDEIVRTGGFKDKIGSGSSRGSVINFVSDVKNNKF